MCAWACVGAAWTRGNAAVACSSRASKSGGDDGRVTIELSSIVGSPAGSSATNLDVCETGYSRWFVEDRSIWRQSCELEVHATLSGRNGSSASLRWWDTPVPGC